MDSLNLNGQIPRRIQSYDPRDLDDPALWSLSHENEYEEPLRRFRFQGPCRDPMGAPAVCRQEWFRYATGAGEESCPDGGRLAAPHDLYAIARGRHLFAFVCEWPTRGQAFIFTEEGDGYALIYTGEEGAEFSVLRHYANFPMRVNDEGELTDAFGVFQRDCADHRIGWFNEQFGLDKGALQRALEAGSLDVVCAPLSVAHSPCANGALLTLRPPRL